MLVNGNVLPTKPDAVKNSPQSGSEIERFIVMVSQMAVAITCEVQVIVTCRYRFAVNKYMGTLDS